MTTIVSCSCHPTSSAANWRAAPRYSIPTQANKIQGKKKRGASEHGGVRDPAISLSCGETRKCPAGLVTLALLQSHLVSVLARSNGEMDEEGGSAQGGIPPLDLHEMTHLVEELLRIGAARFHETKSGDARIVLGAQLAATYAHVQYLPSASGNATAHSKRRERRAVRPDGGGLHKILGHPRVLQNLRDTTRGGRRAITWGVGESIPRW